MRLYASLTLKGMLAASFCCFAAVVPVRAQQPQAPQQAEPAQVEPQSAQPGIAPPVVQSEPAKPVDQSLPDSAATPLDSSVSPLSPQGDAASPGSLVDASDLRNGRVGPNYLLGPEDALEINVFDVPELTKLEVQVGNDGTVVVPLLGSVRAAGLTQKQLRDELAKGWGEKYLQHPQVMVTLKESKSRPVSVVGAVAKPGQYYLTGRRSLVEVIAMAGGLASIGASAGRDVLVERPGGFVDLPKADGISQIGPDRVSVELKKLLYSQDSTLNIEVKPFDIVTVTRAGIVYLVGAFKRPGGYVLDSKDSITALEAMAMAQGLDANARTSQAQIIHRNSTGPSTQTRIDLRRLLHGQTPDVTLANNDILFVPTSNAKAVSKGAALNIVGILSGVLIYRGI